MATLQKNYVIYLVSYMRIIATSSHHAIYVDIDEGKSGELLHVTGSIQQGMNFEARTSSHPFKGTTCEWIKPAGRVQQDKLAQLEAACRMIPPPAKQFHLSKPLVPKDKIRHCQHWVAEAIEFLREKGVLEPLGEDESGDITQRWWGGRS
ncbi:hypothetical protein AYO20_11193 [Fonsecaea nubica]|uniref:Uncharacterized protein n=1 Tax=Fonsecaea nubica TaxID=856822 RepID=A0A178BXK0_9EURO|nr:hypothetical protein AYO20_11193 [Fonsecaea nubica]OAL22368.1 hypothetical protein AYO20_11193 [Fonsecaea nubica]